MLVKQILDALPCIQNALQSPTPVFQDYYQIFSTISRPVTLYSTLPSQITSSDLYQTQIQPTIDSILVLTWGQLNQLFLLFIIFLGLCSLFRIIIWPYVPAVSARRLINAITPLKRVLQDEVRTNVSKMSKPLVLPHHQLNTLPVKGIKPQDLLDHCDLIRKRDVKPDGTAFAYVYETPHSEINHTVNEVFQAFSNTNALSPIVFPSLRYMENCIMSICASMLHSPRDEQTGAFTAVGAVTSGGTESVICAMKAHRDRARDVWGITEPEMIAPITVHPAFVKGAHLLNIKLHLIPILAHNNYMVDLKAYEAKINSNTALLIGSAPSYPHGIIDPISSICQLSRRYNRPLHVDACIGGFFLPFVKKLQEKNQIGSFSFGSSPLPAWDFGLSEVSSISLDLHKYAYTPKGASVIMYRNADLRCYQYFAQNSWPGGLFVSPSLLGTRGGGPIAASWAALQLYGEDGYLELTKTTLKAKQVFIEAIQGFEELEIIGVPQSSIISWRVKDQFKANISIIAIGDALEKPKVVYTKNGKQVEYTMSTKWKIEKQQMPEAIHHTFMCQHINTCSLFRSDLHAALEYVKQNNDILKGQGDAGMYGMTVAIPKVLEVVSGPFLDAFLCEFESQLMTPDPVMGTLMSTKEKKHVNQIGDQRGSVTTISSISTRSLEQSLIPSPVNLNEQPLVSDESDDVSPQASVTGPRRSTRQASSKRK